MPDTRARVSTDKVLHLPTLSVEIGTAVTRNNETGEVVAAVAEDTLRDAIDAHEAPDPPPSLDERVEAVEQAIGAGEGSGQRGIAKRLDDFEDRIAALEGA